MDLATQVARALHALAQGPSPEDRPSPLPSPHQEWFASLVSAFHSASALLEGSHQGAPRTLGRVLGVGGSGAVVEYGPDDVVKFKWHHWTLAGKSREADLLGRCDHPYIVKSEGANTAWLNVLGENWEALIMRKVKVTLHGKIPSGDWPLDDRLEVFAGLVDAIRYLHQDQSTLHRDLKPTNVGWIAGKACLLDLGGACSSNEPNRDVPITCGYAAPEQLPGSPGGAIAEHTDIFGLGVLLYEMLLEERFYRRDAGDAAAYGRWLSQGELPTGPGLADRIAKRWPALPKANAAALQSVIECATRPDVSARTSQAVQLARELEAARSPDAPAQAPATEARPAGLGLLPRYRAKLRSQYERMRLIGFPGRRRFQVRPKDLYVELEATLDLRAHVEGQVHNSKEARKELEGGHHCSLLGSFHYAEQSGRRGVVLLGDPGSGKTTHLIRLALWCSGEDPRQLGLPQDVVPVLIPLRKYGPDWSLESLVARELAETLAYPAKPTKTDEEDAASLGAALMERGQLLVLLDGLDEVREESERARVGEAVASMIESTPGAHFVLTCRYAGYTSEVQEKANLGELCMELHLHTLSEEQRDEFIHKWFSMVARDMGHGKTEAEIEGEAAQSTQGLLEDLARSPGHASQRMAELTQNPLLLTALCLVKHEKGRIPEGRRAVYEHCVEALIELRPAAAGAELPFSADDFRSSLAHLGRWMHEVPGRERASRGELRVALSADADAAKLVPEEVAAEPDQLLNAAERDQGILVGWSTDELGFPHLGFQEYFTSLSAELLTKPGQRTTPALVQHVGDSWWQEVILLYLAGRPASDFEAIVEAALPQLDSSKTQELIALAAAECGSFPTGPLHRALEEASRGGGSPERAALVLQLLGEHAAEEALPYARELAKDQDPTLRAAAQKILGNDAQEQIVQTQGDYRLIKIPAGSFMMGGTAFKVAQPIHRVAVESFWLGEAPVTNGEFGVFLKENPDEKHPSRWGSRRFNRSSQPVVGVSWDQAQRYCAWAGLRLPSEAEWEYACRAKTTTDFWFGDEKSRLGEFGWYRANAEGQTHPVRTKPANPFGLYDMHGQVWEWMADDWSDSYEGLESVHPEPYKSPKGVSRVLRGGSFANVAWVASCAYRYYAHPSDRSAFIGFRPAKGITP